MLVSKTKNLSKMKSIKIITSLLAGVFLLGACTKVLDKTNLSNLSPDLLFSDSNLVQLNMNNLYDNNLQAFGGQNTSSVLSGTQTQLSGKRPGYRQ